MKQRRPHLLGIAALALCLCSLPATASMLFSDLGPPSNAYSCCSGWAVSGSGASGAHNTSNTQAALFTVEGSGSLPVDEIDLAVLNEPGSLNTFDARIFTDSGGLPGVQLYGWGNLFTSAPEETCCSLVSITDMNGVTLTGGQQYFLVVGPEDLSDASFNAWNLNNQGVTGLSLYSADGGATWGVDSGAQFAFDIAGTPEPGSLLLFGTGLAGILGAWRRKSNR